MYKRIIALLIALLSLSFDLPAQSPQYENQVIEKLDIQIMTPSSTEKDVDGIKARIRVCCLATGLRRLSLQIRERGF